MTTVSRIGDMDILASLNIHQQEDGDIVVWIGNPHYPLAKDAPREVEFCECSWGGGKSRKTREALLKLMDAIREDNREKPMYYTREDGVQININKS
jgi:hypothetical protein